MGAAATEKGPHFTLPKPVASEPHPEGPAAPTELNVPLRAHNPSAQNRIDQPVTSGLPLPYALDWTDVSQLRLVDANGSPVPAQFTPVARWGGAAGVPMS